MDRALVWPSCSGTFFCRPRVKKINEQVKFLPKSSGLHIISKLFVYKEKVPSKPQNSLIAPSNVCASFSLIISSIQDSTNNQNQHLFLAMNVQCFPFNEDFNWHY